MSKAFIFKNRLWFCCLKSSKITYFRILRHKSSMIGLFICVYVFVIIQFQHYIILFYITCFIITTILNFPCHFLLIVLRKCILYLKITYISVFFWLLLLLLLLLIHHFWSFMNLIIFARKPVLLRSRRLSSPYWYIYWICILFLIYIFEISFI